MAQKKENKYIYYWVIQGYYSGCYGWEDESFYDKREYTYSDVRKDLKEYKIASPEHAHRIIERRELNENCSYNRTVRVNIA